MDKDSIGSVKDYSREYTKEIEKRLNSTQIGLMISSLISTILLILIIILFYKYQEMDDFINNQNIEILKALEINTQQWQKQLEFKEEQWEHKFNNKNEQWERELKNKNEQWESEFKNRNEQQENKSVKLQEQYEKLKEESDYHFFNSLIYFDPEKSRDSLNFVTTRRIKNIDNGDLNSLLKFPLQPHKFYELEFVAYGKIDGLYLGITPNDQNWRHSVALFYKQVQGYCIRLGNGDKVHSNNQQNYAKQLNLGETITMRVSTMQNGTLSYQIGSTDYGVAFYNIDFVNTKIYAAVALMWKDNEIEIKKFSQN